MKHLLIVLLFIVSFTSFGLDLSSFLHQEIDLTQGIVLPPAMKYNDFSNAKPTKAYTHVRIQDSYFYNESISNGWYSFDFAEDPFDGVIEIWAVGQPSASTTTTLIISCLVGLLLISKRTDIKLTISKYS
jgi:hypothetical protein